MQLGIPLSELLDMDVLSFDSLAETVLKSVYREKYENAWTAMIAAQGDNKAMNKWVRPWKKLAGIRKKEAQPVKEKVTPSLVDDQDSFLRAFNFKGM